MTFKAMCRAWVPAGAVLFTALVGTPAQACATAPAQGSYVRVVDESAVIVWDSERHVEHFIRRAGFQGAAADFGFLVPTPATPRLAEANDGLFGLLEERIRPKFTVTRLTGLRLVSWLLQPPVAQTAATKSSGPAAAPPVRVLSTQRVAGYNAVVLEADNPNALNEWLKSHGYASRPALEDWLAPYVAAHWKITAFKIEAKDPHMPGFAAGVVRMSFPTQTPFFPYSEPDDQRTGKSQGGRRSLRIFCLASERLNGVKGEGKTAEFWSTKTVWSNVLSAQDRQAIADKTALTAADLSAAFWLTAFEDYSTPRPGTADVYFRRSPDHSPKVPPATVHEIDKRIAVPIEPVAAVAAVLCVLALRRRRRSGSARSIG